MHGDIPNASGPAVAEFLQIIKDFSSCLSNRKKNANTFLQVSQSSEKLTKKWGRTPSADGSFRFEGTQDAAVFIVDSEGNFFKGEKGQLLEKILGAMKLTADQVFICNADDLEAVDKKIKEISPRVIVTLGTKAAQSLFNIQVPLDQFRGRFHEYEHIKVMPTFHPSRLLKQPEDKRKVWEDMKQVMAYAGLT